MKFAKIYLRIAALDVPFRSFNCVKACLIITEYFGCAAAAAVALFDLLFDDVEAAVVLLFLPLLALFVGEALCVDGFAEALLVDADALPVGFESVILEDILDQIE